MNHTRIAGALLCAALAFGISAPVNVYAVNRPVSVSAATSGTKVTVTADNLNIRAEASGKSNETGALKKGATVEIVQTKKDDKGYRWGKLADGRGWINLKYTSAGGSGGGGASSMEITTGTKYAVKTSCALNVRSGPGSSYDTVDTLRKGTTVYVVEGRKDSRGNKWGKLDSGKGWVNLKYVTATGDTSGSDNQAASSVSYNVKTTCYLNVRSGAGTGNGVVDGLDKGTVVTITAEKKDSNGNTWGKLSSGKGWVNLKYTTRTTQQSTDGNDASTASYTVKTNCYLNVRSGAGTGNGVVDGLNKGTVVTIVAEKKDSKGNTWGKLSDGTGWVNLSYTTKTSTAQQNNNSANGSGTSANYKVKLTTGGLNVRSEPNSQSSVVKTISDNGTYTIVEEVSYNGRAVWGKLADGSGWISLKYTAKQ